MKKIKVAIFHLAFIYSGGGERLVLEEAIGLSKKGYDVTIFVPLVRKKNCFPELQKKVKIKTFVFPFPSWFPDIELFSILFSCALPGIFFRQFRSFDLYFGANQPGAWIAYLLSKINKKPYAIYLAQPTRLIHPRLIDQKIGLKLVDGITLLEVIRFIFHPIISYIDKISIKGTNLVFANGSYAKGMLDEVYGIRSILCPAGAHISDKFKTLKNLQPGEILLKNLKIPKPFLLITNRHFPQKKFEYAIQLASMLSDMKISLVISGEETAYTKRLKKLAKTLPQVYFTGLLSEKDLKKAYTNAALYLYPAPEEDFGMGIVEAMSYGVPVIAWENGGPTGIITTGKDGFLITPFRVNEWAKTARTILEDKKLYKYISKNAQKTIEKNFSYSKHIDIMYSYLTRLIY